MKVFYYIAISFMISIASFGQAEEIVVQAEEHYNKGEFELAISKLDKAMKKENMASLYILKATILFEIEKYEEVYNTYNDAIKIHPNDIDVLLNRGTFLIQYGEIVEGEDDINKAISLVGDNDEYCYAYVQAGAILGYIRKFEKAYNLLTKATKCDPENINVYITLGAVCNELGKDDIAIENLEKAIEIDPSNFMIYGNLGFIYQEQGNYEEAAKIFNKGLELKPNDAQTIGNLAYAQMKLGELESALKNINQSIDLYPTNSYSYRTRAMIYLANGDKKKACEEINIAIEMGYGSLHGEGANEFHQENCK